MNAAWVRLLLICGVTTVYGLPDLRNTPTDPIIIRVSDEAVLTCIAKEVDNFTVIWKRFKFGRAEILSANSVKVTNDPRVSIIHNEDSDEWLLTIRDVRLSDTAQYACEVNSAPTVFVTRIITVIPPPTVAFSLNHNYTNCCVVNRVISSCLGFCNLQNIVLGTTGATPQDCREYLPKIAACMADGRNHLPCCVREKIPDVCRDVCVGKFNLVNETIVNHYTCSRYSRATLACIAEGIEILPGRPRDLRVEPISTNEITVRWSPPVQNVNTVTGYIINVTELSSFDDRDASTWNLEHEVNSTANSTVGPTSKYVEITVNASESWTTLKNLKQFTMYEIFMVSVNNYGTSLPTYLVRTLTLSPQENSPPVTDENITLPQLPNIRECCASKGMTQERCLDLFCDPVEADAMNLTDMMICAPWINISLTCLVGERDHTSCCRQRGLPELCVPLCRGKVERIDYRHFRCAAFMSSYTSCVMQGYGVIPSPPQDPIINAVHSSWAILQWNPPDNLAGTVIGYNVHYKLLSEDQTMYEAYDNAKSPFLIDDLKPSTQYETYVTAVNKYGTSDASPRIVFETSAVEKRSENATDDVEESDTSYNLTECCVTSQLNSSCLPLCNYKAKMSQLQQLATTCVPDFHKLLKCAVGGRNHVPCCMRRMVSPDCTSLCAGMIPQVASAIAAICIPYIPDIVMCMEEGSTMLPGPVHDLHAVVYNSTSITLEWLPSFGGNISYYEVKYRAEYVDNAKNTLSDPLPDKVLNVTEPTVTITLLHSDAIFNFYVIAINEHGSSIPSSILTFNASNMEHTSAVVSPPHSVTITNKNTTSLWLTWLPPDISHPTDAIKYTVYYKLYNETSLANFTTMSLMAFLDGLMPNSEYLVYVTASTEAGESWPSEQLRVWTDPVFPAFVEMPRIHPSTQIEEGGSMTVLCVATGTPIPKVGIYISGKKIVEEITRHLAARVSNISREMNIVTCTADNGYGVGSQATRRIKISYAPKLEARRSKTAGVGETVILECLVDGYPEPRLTWWRDQEKLNPVIHDSRIGPSFLQFEDKEVFQLEIQDVEESDAGMYYCNAENPYGNWMDKVNLQVDKSASVPNNVSSCCIQEKVHPDCMDACTFDVDIEAVITKEQCIPELSKLVYCAADGSDHRRCCQTWGIPKRCIGLCHGKQTPHIPLCILSWTKQIVSCFQEGKYILPGTPENFRATVVSDSSVLLEWSPPTKNPHTVQVYKVFGRPTSQKRTGKVQNETHGFSLVMTGLKPGITYEFVIKAGNHYGASVISAPLNVFVPEEIAVLESTADSDSDNTVAIIVGITMTIIIIAVVVIAFLYFRRRWHPPPPNGVSFENPSYMREMTNDSTQAVGTNSDQHVNGGTLSGDNTWKSETMHTPDTDNLYEVPSDGTSNLKKSPAKNSFL